MGVNKDLFVSTTAPKKGAPTSIIPTIQPARLRYGSGLGDFQEKLGNNINTERDDLRGMRADAQGELDKAANAVFGGVASGALTAVEDLSYIGDIHNNVQRLRGLENVDSNWLADLMKEGKAGIDKAMPIYKQNPDEVWDWGDSSSYWGALKGVLDSAVGFAIPGAAAVKGVGVLQKAARLNKYVSFLTKSKAVQQGVNTVGAGYISNFGESKMMGVELYENAVDEGKKAYYQQVFDEVKGRNINADPTQIAEIANAEFEQRLPAKLKEIEHNAGDQADKFMLKNKAFMVTDMIGLHGLYKGQGLTRGLLKDPSMKSTIKNMGKLSSDNLLIQGGKESVEEIGQNILQMEGQYQASKASGFDSDDPKELYKRVLKYGTSEQALLEGAMGFFGGGPQRVMTKTATGGYTKKGKAEEQKRFKEQQWMMDKEAKYTDATGEFNTAWYMKNKFNEFEELKTLKKKVIDSGSQEDMDELMKKQSFLKLVDTHFQRGTTEQLERTLKDIRKMSKEEATEAGFDELHKVIADDMLIELNRMEKAYSKYTRYENQDDVFINREDRNNAKFQLDYLDEQLGDAEQLLEDGDPTAQEQIEYYGNMGRETTDHIRNLDKTYKQITSYEAQSAIRKQKREIKKVAKEIGKKQKQAKAKKEATAKKAEKAAKVKAKKEAREEAAKAKTKPKKSKDKNVPGTPKQTSNPESPKSEGVNSTPDTPSTESGAGGALGKFGTKGSPKETKDEAPADIPEVTEEEKIEEKEVQNEDNRKEQRDEKGEKDFGATVESAGNVESDLLTAEDVLLGRTPTTENDDEESDNPPKYANRIGFLTREYTTGEDGVTEDDNEIITSTHADLAHILGIKNLLPGTKIKLVLADDDEIPTYLGEVDGKKQKSTWGEYKAQLKAKVSEDEYQRHFNESVPIKIVTEDGKTVGFVHTVSWVKDDSAGLKESTKRDRNLLRAIRQSVSTMGTVETTIESKAVGHLLKSTDGKQDVGEAFTDPSLTYFVHRGNKQDSTGKIPKNLINKKDLRKGTVYAVLPVGYEKGEGNGIQYLAVPLENKKLDGDFGRKVATSVRKVAEIWLAEELTPEQEKLVEFISDNMGINVTSGEGFEKYISTFLHNTNVGTHDVLMTGKKDTARDGFLNNEENRGKSNVTVMSMNNNHLEFARANGIGHIFMNKGITDAEARGKFFEELERRVTEMYSNVFRESMDTNKHIVFVDSEGEASASTLNTYLGEALQTNLLSKNISSDPEKPQYVYTQQPLITFDDSFVGDYWEKDAAPIKSTPVEDLDLKERARKDFIEGNTSDGRESVEPFDSLMLLEKELEDANIPGHTIEAALNPIHNDNASIYNDLHAARRIAISKGKSTESIDKELSVFFDAYYKAITKLLGIEEKADLQKKLEALKVPKSNSTPTVLEPEASPEYEDAGEFDGMGEEDGDEQSFEWGTPEHKSKVQASADRVVVKELGAVRQSQLVRHYSIGILQKIFKFESDGNGEKVGFEGEMSTRLSSMQESLEAFRRNLNKAEEFNDASKIRLFEQNIKVLSAVVSNWDMIKVLTKGQITLFDGLHETLDEEQSQKDSSESEYWDDSKAFTSDQKDKLSPQIRKFLAFTEAIDKNGLRKKNFFGMPMYEDFDKVYNTIQRLTSGRRPDFKTLLEILDQHKETHSFFPGLVKRLKEASPQIQNQFVVSTTNHYIQMRFIMLKRDKNDKLILVDSNANSAAISKTIIEEWRTNLLNSDGVVPAGEDGESFITEGMRTQLVKELEDLSASVAVDEEITIERIQSILGAFGITISDSTAGELLAGKFYYNKVLEFKDHVNNGLFEILKNNVKTRGELSVVKDDIMGDTVISRLARFEANHSTYSLSNSHRAGTKTVYSYGLNKYMVNRFRELKETKQSVDKQGNKVTVSPLGTKLSRLAFNKESVWLKKIALLDDKGKFRYSKDDMLIIDPKSSMYMNLDVWYTSLEAIKKENSPNSDNSELHKLSEFDNELYRIGQLRASRSDSSGNTEEIIGLLYPTASDKTTVMGMYVPEVKLEWNLNGGLTEATDRDGLIYDALIAPEVERILAMQEAIKKGTDLNNNEMADGGTKFLMLPQLNNIPGMFENGELHPGMTDFNSDIRKQVKGLVGEYLQELISEKIALWDKFGIGIAKGEELTFLDSGYVKKLRKSVSPKYIRRAAATDMVMQYLIGNSEMMKMFIGDPANFFKSADKTVKKRLIEQIKNGDKVLAEKSLTEADIKGMDHTELYEYYDEEERILMAEDTFINMGKRLAGDVGPGKEMPGAYDENVKYLMIDEKELPSTAIEKIKLLFGANSPQAKAYSNINSTDAQEYTTWQEHLHVMYSMGNLSGKEHKRLHSALSKGGKLSNSDLKKVMTPMKPVYVNNVVDESGLYERRVYIKTSSFPLIPQLTAGLEMDKLRRMMEKSGIQRAAYMSAVKVGGVASPYKLLDDNGNFTDGDISKAVLEVPRSGFRIQQDIPYKETKREISRVTQASKNMFTNMLSQSGFSYDGNDNMTGEELEREYIKQNHTIFKLNAENLKKELSSDGTLDLKKVKEILKVEAAQRGYPITDQELLELDEELKFFMLSPAALKYESLLNSIVSNRIIKWKMPGKSYVQGAPEGFKVWEDEKDKLDQSDIKFTKYWNGTQLESDQILIPFKFLNSKGEKLNIKDFLTGDKLDIEKLSPELLEIFGLRIPNQGPNSQKLLRIAGFLPDAMGDLAIVPRDVVVQMGSDFDVDKLYTYMYNTELKDGKLTRFNMSEPSTTALEGETVGEISSSDQIKHAQNKIIDVYYSIHKNQNEEVQRIINAPLNEWKLQEISDEIGAMRKARNRAGKKNLFTGMSDNYQRGKFMNATAGKAGIGVFSLDSMFNALVQGKTINIKPDKIMGPFKVSFGGRSSTNELSDPKALDKITYKSDVISGYQSASVDNEKLQILDKLNINPITFPIIKILNQLGFLEEVPLFLSQDIILDYVEELNLLRSKAKDYVSSAESVAYSNVVEKYTAMREDLEQEGPVDAGDPSAEQMYTLIKHGNKVEYYAEIQLALLAKFTMLEEKGRLIGAVQAAINTDSAGIPKSFIETEAKLEAAMKLEKKLINGGTLLSKDGEFTSINGLATEYGLKTAYKLWNRFNNPSKSGVKVVTKHIEALSTSELGTAADKARFRSQVWEGLKSYLFTTEGLGLTEEDVDEERKRLFIDQYQKTKEKYTVTDKKTGVKTEKTRTKLILDHYSLASVVEKFSSAPAIKSNVFIQRLRADIQKNGTPSLLRFNASAKDDWDNHNLYTHFIDMLVNNKPLGVVNGQYYDTRKLAEDMIKYSYFSGGVQQAIQFIKYIPPSYLYSIPFADKLSKMDFSKSDLLGNPGWAKSLDNLPEFVLQYIQHNPNVVTVDDEFKVEEKGDKKEAPNIISFDAAAVMVEPGDDGEKSVARPLVAVSHQGGKKGKALYKTVATKGGRVYYENIPTKGAFGMDEYKHTGKHNQHTDSIVKRGSVIKTKSVEPTAVPPSSVELKSAAPKRLSPQPTKVDVVLGKAGKDLTPEGVLTSILNNKAVSEYNRALAEEMLKVIKGIPGLKITRAFLGINKAGVYSFRKNLITINTDTTRFDDRSINEIAEIVLHEFVHAPTGFYARLYEQGVVGKDFSSFTPQEKEVVGKMTDEQTLALRRLHTLYVDMTERLDQNDPKLPAKLRELLKSNGSFDEIKKNYWRSSFPEFISEVMASAQLREILNETEYYNEISWLTKIRELVTDLLKAFGMDLKKGSALEAAMHDILFLMDESKQGNLAMPKAAESKNLLANALKGKGNANKLNDYKLKYNFC